MYPDRWTTPAISSFVRPAMVLPTMASSVMVALVSVTDLAAQTVVERRQQCERRDVSRVVELRETPGGGLPCEVVYRELGEGGSERVLWRATSDRAFCTARFEAFVVKLESRLSWVCEAIDGDTIVTTPETSIAIGVTRSTTRPTESVGEESEATAAASRPVSQEQPEETPPVGMAVPAARDTPVPTGASVRAMTPFEQLRALAPEGIYVAVPVPSIERPDDGRIPSRCPPGGAFSWKVEDEKRPVFALGDTIELTIRLPEAALDEAAVLPVVSTVGEGATRELQTLSPAPTGQEGSAIDLRVAPRGPGSGALSPGICRYALDE